MRNPDRAHLLGPLLKSVSRSFYLTLNVLPKELRDSIGLAYLLARAADTIADTALIPPDQRLELLLSLRSQVNGTPDQAALQRIAQEVAGQQSLPDEKILLESLGTALVILYELSKTDRDLVVAVVTTLTRGMEFDLRTFPDESSRNITALRQVEELDRYTYLVAGCVGEFWTKMTYLHMPNTLQGNAETVLAHGVRFGKALQMTNILRDCSKDLRIGRCYLPTTMLDRFGLTPLNLLLPDASILGRPVLYELIQTALDQFRDAVAYTLAIPRSSIRLRLACLWPILIGLETLLLLVHNDAWLDPARISKIKRADVYRIMASSLPMVVSDRLLRLRAGGLIQEIEAQAVSMKEVA